MVAGDGGEVVIDALPKVRRYSAWGLVGEAGDTAVLELAPHAFEQESKLRRLANAMRTLWLGLGDNREARGDGEWLFVDPEDGQLTHLGADGSLSKPLPKGFSAIGCGAAWALGALASGRSAAEAVKTACQYNAFCRGPVRTWRKRLR